nr:MAG TPA: Erythromycin resistance leader peptide [Caudoviricetes sp.]
MLIMVHLMRLRFRNMLILFLTSNQNKQHFY